MAIAEALKNNKTVLIIDLKGSNISVEIMKIVNERLAVNNKTFKARLSDIKRIISLKGESYEEQDQINKIRLEKKFEFLSDQIDTKSLQVLYKQSKVIPDQSQIIQKEIHSIVTDRAIKATHTNDPYLNRLPSELVLHVFKLKSVDELVSIIENVSTIDKNLKEGLTQSNQKDLIEYSNELIAFNVMNKATHLSCFKNIYSVISPYACVPK